MWVNEDCAVGCAVHLGNVRDDWHHCNSCAFLQMGQSTEWLHLVPSVVPCWPKVGNSVQSVSVCVCLLTPCSRVLLEKLTGSQLVKKFPTFYGTRIFITAFTSARHLSLSWASSILSIPPHPTSWRSSLILSSHLRLGLPSGLFPSVFPPKPCTRLSSPYVLHAPAHSHFSRSPEQYWVRIPDR